MYIILHLILCFIVTVSHSVSIYAGITFNSTHLPSDFPRPGPFSDKLYFFYSNTVVDNGENRFDDTYRHLDSIASGLSVYTYPVYSSEKLPPHANNKHLLTTLESWCYVLSLFLFYPRFEKEPTFKDTPLFPHLLQRCMNLNYNSTNYKVDLDFKELLMNTETKLDDAFLFEKYSRMCPRPCFLDNKKMEVCRNTMKLKDQDLVNDFVLNPNCYLNDFFQKECVPYSYMKKKTLNSFKSLLDPDTNLHMYADKWSYLYMPKRVELELSMENLSYLLFMKVVENCKSRNCKDIQDLLSALALKNLSVKFVVGRFDPNAKDPDKKMSISFGLTFKLEQLKSNQLNKNFDFLIENMDFNNIYRTLLGSDFYTPSLQPQEDQKPNFWKELPMKMWEALVGVNTEPVEKKVVKIPDLFENKCDFSKLTGFGFHRDVTLFITLDPKIFKKLKPVGSRYYLKLVHMLDASVFIDTDEMGKLFKTLEDESEVFDLPPDPVMGNEEEGTVNLKTLWTPYVDIEQPEKNSSPVIYNGYVVLDESVRNFKTVNITFTVKLHSRYMNMRKVLTQELKSVDRLGLLRSQVSSEYSMVLVSQPTLYILNKPSTFKSLPLTYPYLRYLRFLASLSFNNFSSDYFTKPDEREDSDQRNWVQLYLNQCNNFGLSVKLCQGHRTGLAISTKVVNTYFCNPIIKEMGGDVVESTCYVAYSVPVGNQSDYTFVRNVTFATIIFSCVVSLVMALLYFENMTTKTVSTKKKK